MLAGFDKTDPVKQQVRKSVSGMRQAGFDFIYLYRIKF